MIRLQDADFSYGRRKIFESLNFTADDGELLAVLGANGAGKSTLLKLMSGSLSVSSGTVLIGDSPINSMSARELARRRAVLEQRAWLSFEYTALDTVLLGRYAYNVFAQNSASDISLALACLDKVGLKGFEDRLYTRLSGGECQRVQLARALCQLGENPKGKSLLLDEPAASLDPAHSHAAMSAASKAAKNGACVVAVLHDPNLAYAYATRALLLKDGKIFAQGSPDEVLTPKLLAQTYDAPCNCVNTPEGGRAIYFPAPKL